MNPVFGFDGTLGFADPGFNQFFVNDFGAGSRRTFNIAGAGIRGFSSPFQGFEFGLTPERVGGFGTFGGTTPLTVQPGPF